MPGSYVSMCIGRGRIDALQDGLVEGSVGEKWSMLVAQERGHCPCSYGDVAVLTSTHASN